MPACSWAAWSPPGPPSSLAASKRLKEAPAWPVGRGSLALPGCLWGQASQAQAAFTPQDPGARLQPKSTTHIRQKCDNPVLALVSRKGPQGSSWGRRLKGGLASPTLKGRGPLRGGGDES